MGILGIIPPANSADNLGSGYGRFEVKRPWNFKVEFQSTNGADVPWLTGNAGKSLSAAVKTVTKPQIVSQVVEIKSGNEMYNLAGKTKWASDTTEVVFYDIISPVIYGTDNATTGDDQAGIVSAASVLYTWQNAVQNVYTGDGGLSVNYKCNMFVKQFDPAGKQVEMYVYMGGWPSDVRYGETLDYTQESEASIVTATFKFDKIFRAGFSSTTRDDSVPGFDVAP